MDKQKVAVNYRLLWGAVLLLIVAGMLATTLFA